MCYLLVGPLPEDSQGEDSSDGRSEVARHWLDVDIQLAAIGRLQDGNPHHTHHHQDHSDNPGTKKYVSFTVSSHRPPFLVNDPGIKISPSTSRIEVHDQLTLQV